METFSMRLKFLRTRLGLTQVDVAESIKVNVCRYCDFENGKHIPRMPTLHKIANYFNVSLDYLMAHDSKGTEDPGPTDASDQVPMEVQRARDKLKMLEEKYAK